MDPERTYIFFNRDFDRIRTLAAGLMGITLSDAKLEMVYGRLKKRLRQLGIKRFDDYCDLLESRDARELEQFTNALTTNLTAFFRQPNHFEYLATSVLPELIEARSGSRRLRLWSAGCSTGEEPYSIAMTLLGCNIRRPDWDVRILATDIDSSVLARAKAGTYPLAAVTRLDHHCQNWLRNGSSQNADTLEIAPGVRELIVYKRLNLLQPWPFHGPFDCIFCRNVMIYFSRETQKSLLHRYADMLPIGGYLFIGFAELLYNVTDRFELIGKSIYRRIA